MTGELQRRYRLVVERRMCGLNDLPGDVVWARTMEDRFPRRTQQLALSAWRLRQKNREFDALGLAPGYSDRYNSSTQPEPHTART